MDSHGNLGHTYIQTREHTHGLNDTREHSGASDRTHQGSPANLPSGALCSRTLPSPTRATAKPSRLQAEDQTVQSGGTCRGAWFLAAKAQTLLWFPMTFRPRSSLPSLKFMCFCAVPLPPSPHIASPLYSQGAPTKQCHSSSKQWRNDGNDGTSGPIASLLLRKFRLELIAYRERRSPPDWVPEWGDNHTVPDRAGGHQRTCTHMCCSCSVPP